jgi:hypothetical protein
MSEEIELGSTASEVELGLTASLKLKNELGLNSFGMQFHL